MVQHRALRTAGASLLLAGLMAVQPALAQPLPPSPSPVAVSLDPSSTAVLVLDITTQTCGGQARCTAMLPRVANLLDAARGAGAMVVYSTPASQPPILPDVAPADGDPVVVGLAQDRFFDTALDEILRTHGIGTLVLVGWRYDGSVLYTAVGGTIRNYTVVVPDDGTAAAQDYDVAARPLPAPHAAECQPDQPAAEAGGGHHQPD